MTVGERMKKLRKENGLTLEDLAQMLGKNKSTIHRYEKGEIENLPLASLEPIATALKTTPAFLMGWEDDEITTSNEIMSDEDYRKVFVRRLSYYMKLRGKNQMDLMNDLNLSSSTVSTWCTGKKLPRMNKIQMLADYFGIEKSDLIEEKYKDNEEEFLIEICANPKRDYEQNKRIATYLKKMAELSSEMSEKDLEMVISFMERLKGDK